MDIETIRENWINTANKNAHANIAIWDSAAEHFSTKPLADWENNPFLKFLNSTFPLNKSMSALDIGCGAATYSIPLAQRIGSVTGIDLSGKMIDSAKNKAAGSAAINTVFRHENWSNFNIKKENFEKQFDLVFAHNSPAISDAANFEKMIACSKKYCVFVKPCKRSDSILDALKAIAKIDVNYKGNDAAIPYAFSLAWQLGYEPKLMYREETWEVEKKFEDACLWYIGRIKTYKDLTKNEENTLKAALNSMTTGGIVYENTKTTIVTMYWEV